MLQVCSVRLLLCDEPTVGVDPQSRNAIFECLERLNREGLTIKQTATPSFYS